MPRSARKKSRSGIYHIMLRGINKQTIFFDDEDREVFLNRLKLTKENEEYKIYAFCLMGNHVHLLLKENGGNLSKVIQKALTSYIFWYNRKYERIGNLFQDRFKSEAIEDDKYLLSAVRYIHQNPVKIGIGTIEEYLWSSYSAYISDKKSIVDTELVLGILGNKEAYKEFMKIDEQLKFIENESKVAISDEKLIEKIEYIKNKNRIKEIQALGKEARDEFLSIIRKIPGTSIRQISRVTGIPISIVRYV